MKKMPQFSFSTAFFHRVWENKRTLVFIHAKMRKKSYACRKFSRFGRIFLAFVWKSVLEMWITYRWMSPVEKPFCPKDEGAGGAVCLPRIVVQSNEI